MIKCQAVDGQYDLKWDGACWRDKAGHIWELDMKTSSFKSKEHGVTNNWTIPDDINIKENNANRRSR